MIDFRQKPKYGRHGNRPTGTPPSPYAQGGPLFEFRISNSSVFLRLAVYVNKDKHYIESFGMF